MPLTHAQKTGLLEVAILAYLAAAEGGRFARTAAAFKKEVQVAGVDGGGLRYELFGLSERGSVLKEAWANTHGIEMPLTHAQRGELEAAILAYLAAAEGRRYARTVAAFKVEAHLPGRGNPANLVLEKACKFVHRKLKKIAQKWALYDAIQAGDLAEVQLYASIGIEIKILIGTMPEDKDKDDVSDFEWEASPMYWAACYNQLEIVRFYVESGHDKEEGMLGGETPLMAAAGEGHMEVVRYLVEQGADKDAEYSDDNALSRAATNGHVEVVRYLVEQGVGNAYDDNAFRSACYNGHVDVAEHFLDKRHVDIDRTDHFYRFTVLHYAARDGKLHIAQLLLRYGAKLDIKDYDGRTPADIAIRNGHHDIADAIRAEEIRRRDHGFKRDRSTIPGTEEHEAAKRPRAEREAAEAAEAAAAAAADESDDDDDDDDDDEGDDA